MKLKSYRSETVEAAIRLASVELGEDAVLLGSRKGEGAEEPAGRYEVTFAVLDRGRRKSEAGGEASSPRNSATEETALGGTRAAGVHGPGGAKDTAGKIGFPHWRNFVPPNLTPKQNEDGSPRHVSTIAGQEQSGGETQSGGEQHEGALPAGRSGESGANGSGSQGESRAGQRRGGLDSQERMPIRLGLPGEPVAEKRPPPDSHGTRETFVHDEPDWVSALAAAAPVKIAASREEFRSHLKSEPPRHAGKFSPRLISQTPLTDALSRIQESIEQLRAYLEDRLGLEEQAARLRPMRGTADPPLSVYSALTANEVEPEVASHLVSELPADLEQKLPPGRLREMVADRIRSLCRTDSTLGRHGSRPRIAAFVGPSGAGKTTAVVKLAMRHGLENGQKVLLIGVDPLRVGAFQQLETYAELLGIPSTLVGEPESLPGVLENLAEDEEPRRPRLILIDTPGYGPAEWPQARRLANCLAGPREADIHLVIGLNTKPRDLRRILESYRIFRPQKLLFTRLDESERYGAMLNESVRMSLPLSFFSTGQCVPEDLAPATEPYLAELVLKEHPLG